MAYDIALADRVRAHLAAIPNIKIEEKKMFGGLALLVNGKMCINIGDNHLICRYTPCLRKRLLNEKDICL